MTSAGSLSLPLVPGRDPVSAPAALYLDLVASFAGLAQQRRNLSGATLLPALGIADLGGRLIA